MYIGLLFVSCWPIKDVKIVQPAAIFDESI